MKEDKISLRKLSLPNLEINVKNSVDTFYVQMHTNLCPDFPERKSSEELDGHKSMLK